MWLCFCFLTYLIFPFQAEDRKTNIFLESGLPGKKTQWVAYVVMFFLTFVVLIGCQTPRTTMKWLWEFIRKSFVVCGNRRHSRCVVTCCRYDLAKFQSFHSEQHVPTCTDGRICAISLLVVTCWITAPTTDKRSFHLSTIHFFRKCNSFTLSFR